MFKVSFIALVLCGIISGCAGIFPSAPVVLTSCSYDQAWGIALASVNEFELRQVDKVGGKIETEWLLFDSRRLAGVLARNENKERMRFFVTLERKPKGIQIETFQLREYFSPMGIQSQSGWRRISPDEGEEQRLASRISQRLKAKGCVILS
mgnify:CR=1 FL=1